MPQEVADLFKGRVGLQIMNVEPAVREHAAWSVQVADCRGGGDDALKAGCRFRVRARHRGRLYTAALDPTSAPSSADATRSLQSDAVGAATSTPCRESRPERDRGTAAQEAGRRPHRERRP